MVGGVLLISAGCGAHPGATAPPTAPVVPPSYTLTAEQRSVLLEALAILEATGLQRWAISGRSYLDAGRVFVADLERRTGNPWGIAGYDGVYLPHERQIWLNANSLRYMAPRHVAMVFLNEIVHAVTPGDDTHAEHEMYNALVRQLRREWERLHNRPFNEAGPGDERYAAWFEDSYWWKEASGG